MNHKSPIRSITRPHLIDAEASPFMVIFLIVCVILLVVLILGLLYSCLKHFQWFRNLIDPEARRRHDEGRAERQGLMAGREIGAFARGFGRVMPKRSLLCDRSGYLGGGRGYGWKTRAYGDGNVDDTEADAEADADSGNGSLNDGEADRRSSGSSRSVQHRDDCNGQCGLSYRRASRDRSPE